MNLPQLIVVPLCGRQRCSKHGNLRWVITWSNLTSATISSDLDICCWDGLKCNHPTHVLPEDMKSSDLSRYPPPMMLGLAGAISKKLQDIGKASSRPTISWNTTAPTDPHVVHRDPASDQPSSSIGTSNFPDGREPGGPIGV